MSPRSRRSLWTDRAEQLLDSTPSRLALSFLIVLSVLPERVISRLFGLQSAEWLPWFFLALFGPEVLARAITFAGRLRQRRAGRSEAVLLALDFVAVTSFLPWHWMFHDVELLRLFRFARLLLLLGYWGGVLRDLWSILAGRERRRHVVFVLLGGILLSFVSAVVLSTTGPLHDFDDDGIVDQRDRAFPNVLWWSFRQVQDPGNLVERPEQGAIVAASLLLTFGGLLLFSFLIGVGTSAVEELVSRSRLLPVGLRHHTVVLGFGPHSHLLLSELGEITRKNFGALKAAVLGAKPEPPDPLRERPLRSVRYRQGAVDSVEDVARLDIPWASRVIVLGDHDTASVDAQVISSTLAVRSLDPAVETYPVLEHEKSFPAARAAGGAGTHVVAAGSFLGYYLAQNVLDPGIYRLYRQLLTSAGCEIYTCIFTPDQRAEIRSRGHGKTIDLPALWDRAYREHGVTLLGLFVAEPGQPDLAFDELDVLLQLHRPSAPAGVLDVDGGLRCAALRGMIGISLRFEDLRKLARRTVLDPIAEAPPLPDSAPQIPPLEPSTAEPERLLLCGGSPRIPRFLDFLSRSTTREVDATVLVRSTDRVTDLLEDLTGALEGNLSGLSRAPRHTVEVRQTAGGADVVRIDPPIRVRLRSCDWTDVSRLLRHPEIEIGRLDAVAFLPRRTHLAETDGLVALDCLRMAQLAASGAVALKRSCRILGLVEDPAKGDLLERRLDAMEDSDRRFTIVAGERVRHHYVMQNVFVPGLHRFYFELIQTPDVRLRRMRPARVEGHLSGDFDATDLALELARRGRTFVGLEIPDPESGAPIVLCDPRELANGERFEWRDVRAVYVLSSTDEPIAPV